MGEGGREVNPQGWEDGVVSCAHPRVFFSPLPVSGSSHSGLRALGKILAPDMILAS